MESRKKERKSNIEVLRILMMLVIIAHHYVVNSGITTYIDTVEPNEIFDKFNTYFAYLYGSGGKIAINVFLLITGYFSCKQQIKYKKIVFFILQVLFYRLTIYLIFILTGYESFSITEFVKTFLEIPYLFGKGFTSSYIGLYFLIPYLNFFVEKIEKKQLERLIIVLICMFSFIPTICLNTVFEYMGWYITVYLIGSYIRLYQSEWMTDKRKILVLLMVTLFICVVTIIGLVYLSYRFDMQFPIYWFVMDSNKLLAILSAIMIFLYFLNVNIGSIRCINVIASTTFGVLLIHASSDTMRRWLWQDICQNLRYFKSDNFVIHAILCTSCVYISCVCIDLLRKCFLTLILKFFDKIQKDY